MSGTTTLTIAEFGRRLRAHELSAEAVTEACLNRIAADNPRLNAFIQVTGDAALRQARESDRELAAGHDRGPLHGVPISLKDLLDMRGVPTTAGSRVRDGHVAAHDARAVAHLRAAGAVFLGKTNLHEFAFGTTNEDSAFGPARNPHDIARSPGGSSGGSAAGIVAGMSLASIGTDTGGSVRIPSAACGVVGLKPSFGEISCDSVVPLSRTLDHVGPLAQTVADAWLLYRALLDSPADGTLVVRTLAGVHVGVLRAYFCDVLDDDVRRRFEEALERLQSSGAIVHDVEIRHAESIAPIYLHIVLGDAAAYHARTLEEIPERYTPPVRLRLEMGRYVLAEDYVRALNGRRRLREAVDGLFADHNVLVLPTLPIPAPLLGVEEVRVGSTSQPARNLMLRLTQLFNLTGHPAISIPCGTTSAGLPCGLQLVGPRQKTETLLSLALACESLMPASRQA